MMDMIRRIDGPAYYVNEYSEPRRAGLAPRVRVVYIDLARANRDFDAMTDYAHKLATVER